MIQVINRPAEEDLGFPHDARSGSPVFNPTLAASSLDPDGAVRPDVGGGALHGSGGRFV